MLEDPERGRRLELPWLSGAVVRLGKEVGVMAPTHQFITTVLTPFVNGKRTSELARAERQCAESMPSLAHQTSLFLTATRHMNYHRSYAHDTGFAGRSGRSGS